MSVYINGTGVISAQQTFDKKVLQNGFEGNEGNKWLSQEPDYSLFIDGKQIRRMSRIIRMGIVASLLATREAGIEQPESIIVGTAFGCLEDTYSFLSKLVQYQEDMLSPTAFIHSTHNTIAAQIALLFQCRGYNSTYVHRSLSFESALTDAMLLIEENSADNVLVGGIDEITDTSFDIMNRMGFYKEPQLDATNFYEPGKGSVAGEGATFFNISRSQTASSYAKIAGVESYSFMDGTEVRQKAMELLARNNVDQPDLLLTGHNGDRANDIYNDFFAESLDCKDRILKYKHWCGEYATANAFATWLGAEILKHKTIPYCFSEFLNQGERLNNILIYNQQEGIHHSLILLQHV